MYVCICQAVTEKQVRDAVGQGAHSLSALREHLGVASECGKCARCAHGIIQECRNCPSAPEGASCAG